MKKVLSIFTLISLLLCCNNKAEDVKVSFIKLPINNNLYYYTKSGGLAGSIEEITFTIDTLNLKNNSLTFFILKFFIKLKTKKL